jgi:hypothetical protein
MIAFRYLVVLLCSFGAGAQAATISAKSCSSADVQSAINSASSGDTVSLPPGCSATWNTGVVIPSSKGITLAGGGAAVARGSLADREALISFASNAAATTRISGFNFSDQKASGGAFITITDGSETSAKFRIDNCTFNAPDMDIFIRVLAPVYGVIDHNTFQWNSNAEVIHIEAYGAGSTAGWTNDVIPGSDQAVYIEDNKFLSTTSGNPAYFWGASAVQSYYGARTVFRYNYCQMCQVDQHGTAGMVGARWWEIYENTFYVVQNGNQSSYVALRGGSGVVFNNHTSGYANSGAGVITLYEEDSGYPALYQIGRGKNQALAPAYVWGNSSTMTVESASSNVQVKRDFYLSAMPGYTPFVYPHPLVSGNSSSSSGSGSLVPPSNLRILP